MNKNDKLILEVLLKHEHSFHEITKKQYKQLNRKGTMTRLLKHIYAVWESLINRPFVPIPLFSRLFSLNIIKNYSYCSTHGDTDKVVNEVEYTFKYKGKYYHYIYEYIINDLIYITPGTKLKMPELEKEYIGHDFN